MKRWRKRQPGRSIAQDLEVRGRRDSLDLLSIGAGAAIDRCCIFWLADEEGAQPSICVGSRAYVGPFCYLGSHRSLTIGEDTIIGGFSYLITGNHRFDRKDIPVRDQGYKGAAIQIGQNVWLGCHVVVLPGVTIGDDVVVGAGAVVTRNIPSGETWGGVPARKIEAAA